MSNLAPLGNLDTVKGTLSLEYNLNLTDVSGLQNIKYLGGFNMYYNPQLQELSSFDSLDYIGFLNVHHNTILQSLSGFENQRNVDGEVSIGWNSKLSSIEGIRHFNPETVDSVFIWVNPMLSICQNQFVCDFLQTEKKVSVGSNSPGCNSVEEIETQCDIMSIGQSDQSQIQLYPNPFYNMIQIDGLETENAEISVFNALGSKISSSVLSFPVLDLSGLMPGIYFVQIYTGDHLAVKRMIKI